MPLRLLSDRIIFADFMRGGIAFSIVIVVAILGYYDKIDDATITGLLGTVIGAVSATSGAAVGGRAAKSESEEGNGRQAN